MQKAAEEKQICLMPIPIENNSRQRLSLYKKMLS
jgi:hypothetical protein